MSDNTEDAHGADHRYFEVSKRAPPTVEARSISPEKNGAFYFTLVDFTGRLVYLKDVLGIKSSSHCKLEAGSGKCIIDGKLSSSSKNAADELILRGGAREILTPQVILS